MWALAISLGNGVGRGKDWAVGRIGAVGPGAGRARLGVVGKVGASTLPS